MHVMILGSTATRGSVRCHDRKLQQLSPIRKLVKKASLIAGRNGTFGILLIDLGVGLAARQSFCRRRDAPWVCGKG
jgi:hypothetical protein